tara:strand:+ start:1335 stop:2399 length:1065 start_codon:yes stop_codon:yes gene_type:complete
MANNLIEKHSKYFFTACFIGIILLSILLMKSFIITIVGAVLLTYIFYPLNSLLIKAVKSKRIAAFLSVLLVILIIIIPLIFAANALIGESIIFFHKTKNLDISKLEATISEYTSENVEVGEQIKNMLNKFSLFIAKKTSDLLVSLPKKMLEGFVMLFLMYYLFLDGKYVLEKIKDHIPLKRSHRKNITDRFSSVIYASLYGIVVTAFVQGAIGALGLWIFGVQSPILWGLVMIILSMLPFLGAFIVWMPAAIFKLVIGDTFNGLGLLFYGLFIISTIDNVVRPAIIGSKGKIHPALVLLGVLGGLEIFGLFGIILGPLILSIFTVFLELYFLEKEPHHSKIKIRNSQKNKNRKN